jgi:hypothetical protein
MLPPKYLPIRIRRSPKHDVLRITFGDDPRAVVYLYCLPPENQDVVPRYLTWDEGTALMKTIASALRKASEPATDG